MDIEESTTAVAQDFSFPLGLFIGFIAGILAGGFLAKFFPF